MRRTFRSTVALAAGALAACAPPTAPAVGDPDADTVRVPLTELVAGTYLGFQGGLYPGGANAPPAEHLQRGLEAARRIQPLDGNGNPGPTGQYVLLSIGMSNTTQEFCGGAPVSCDDQSFVGQALADAAVDHNALIIVDGAQGGEALDAWLQPSMPTFDRVRDQRLSRLGVTEAQVQIAWVKQANRRPASALPAADADAYAIAHGLADLVRALHARYPNLQLVFLSSRVYGGYAGPGSLNPEPFAYEGGFGVKWVVEAQIRQAGGEPVDAEFGDLRPAAAPWIGWGPYLWANGETPRADGLTWRRTDFRDDATHPAAEAQRKVGALLLSFMKSSPLAACWFLEGRTC